MRAPLTSKGALRLRAELEELKSVKRPAVIAAIAEARPTQKSKAGVSSKKSPGGSSANPPRTDTPSPAPLQNNAPSAVQVQGVPIPTQTPRTAARSMRISKWLVLRHPVN